MTCECKRIAEISGKCSDMFHFCFEGKEREGYVPVGAGIGGGDYIEFKYCLDCGKIQSDQFPVDITNVFPIVELLAVCIDNPGNPHTGCVCPDYSELTAMENMVSEITRDYWYAETDTGYIFAVGYRFWPDFQRRLREGRFKHIIPFETDSGEFEWLMTNYNSEV